MGGRRPSGAGLGLAFGVDRGGSSKVDRVAVAGVGERLNDVFWIGADGSGRGLCPRTVAGLKAKVGCELYWTSSSGESVEDEPSRSTLELLSC
jgi:hypothetical protein